MIFDPYVKARLKQQLLDASYSSTCLPGLTAEERNALAETEAVRMLGDQLARDEAQNLATAELAAQEKSNV